MSTATGDAHPCSDDASGKSDEGKRSRSQRHTGRGSTRSLCAGNFAGDRWINCAAEQSRGVEALYDRFETRTASFFLESRATIADASRARKHRTDAGTNPKFRSSAVTVSGGVTA